MTHSVKITVHGCEHLEDVESMGKNDCYARFSFACEDKKQYDAHKTSTKKNAGKRPEWNETLTMDNFDKNTCPELFVEVMEQDMTADAPIAYCMIPMSQILSAENHVLKGCFKLYNADGKQEDAVIHLTVAIVAPGQAAPASHSSEIQGLSQKTTDHEKRIKGLKNREKAADIGMAAGIIGGILGAKALNDAHNKPAVPKEL